MCVYVKLCKWTSLNMCAHVSKSEAVHTYCISFKRLPSQWQKQRSGLWKCHSVSGLALRGPSEPGGFWPGCRFRGDRIMWRTEAATSSSLGGWGQAERHGGGSLFRCLFHQLPEGQGAWLNGHSKIEHAQEGALSNIYSIPSKVRREIYSPHI